MLQTDWSKHHELTRNDPPSDLLIKALAFVQNKNQALDIGDGGLKDTRYFLDQGFEVTAVDQEKRMMVAAESIRSEKLHCQVSKFVDFKFPRDTFDIASAMFALPFDPPDIFEIVFKNVRQSLLKNGIFCGQLFGTRDGWSENSNMTFHTKAQAEALFAEMNILSFVETEKDSHTKDGKPKHWHLFHVIAKKM